MSRLSIFPKLRCLETLSCRLRKRLRLFSVLIFIGFLNACSLNAKIQNLENTSSSQNADAVIPKLSINSTSVLENAGNVTLIITQSETSSIPTSVSWATGNGTAIQSSDYSNSNGTATIAAGTLTATISVPIINDFIYENSESFTVTLSNPVHASLDDVSFVGTVTITDDDPLPALSINSVSVSESAGTATFLITQSAASSLNTTVHFATANNTGVAGTNYTAQTGTATILAGATSTSINVSITDTPAICESDRTFYLNLSSPTNATITSAQGVGTITENDFPTISIANVTITEGDMAIPVVSLSQACNVDISMTYATTNGTATGGTDFSTISNGTLKIFAGTTSTKAAVTTFDDSLVEGSENFTVTISNPDKGSITTNQATVTITDNDVPLALSSDVVQVSTKFGSACALTSGGAVKCWGSNLAGEIGIGTVSVNVIVPTVVSGISSGATKVSVGGQETANGFACAIVSGAAKCWGINSSGQLGDGTGTQRSSPVTVSGLTSGVTDISVGGFHSCAVVSGAAKCWGNNSYG